MQDLLDAVAARFPKVEDIKKLTAGAQRAPPSPDSRAPPEQRGGARAHAHTHAPTRAPTRAPTHARRLADASKFFPVEFEGADARQIRKSFMHEKRLLQGKL